MLPLLQIWMNQIPSTWSGEESGEWQMLILRKVANHHVKINDKPTPLGYLKLLLLNRVGFEDHA